MYYCIYFGNTTPRKQKTHPVLEIGIWLGGIKLLQWEKYKDVIMIVRSFQQNPTKLEVTNIP